MGSKYLLDFPEQWASLVTPSTVWQLEQQLQKVVQAKNAALNHHSAVLIEVAGFLLQNDTQQALQLISDRLQFLRLLGRGKRLPLCLQFYDELRGDHRADRIKRAELRANVLTPAQRRGQQILDELDPNDPVTPSNDATAHPKPAAKTGRRGRRGRQF